MNLQYGRCCSSIAFLFIFLIIKFVAAHVPNVTPLPGEPAATAVVPVNHNPANRLNRVAAISVCTFLTLFIIVGYYLCYIVLKFATTRHHK